MFIETPFSSDQPLRNSPAPAVKTRPMFTPSSTKETVTLMVVGFVTGAVLSSIVHFLWRSYKRLDRRTGEPLEVLPVREPPPVVRRVSFANTVEYIRNEQSQSHTE